MLSLKTIFARRGHTASEASPSSDSTLNLVATESDSHTCAAESAAPSHPCHQQPNAGTIKSKKPRKLRRKQWQNKHAAAAVPTSKQDGSPLLVPVQVDNLSSSPAHVSKSLMHRFIRFRATKAHKPVEADKKRRDSGVASASNTGPSKGLLAAGGDISSSDGEHAGKGLDHRKWTGTLARCLSMPSGSDSIKEHDSEGKPVVDASISGGGAEYQAFVDEDECTANVSGGAGIVVRDSRAEGRGMFPEFFKRSVARGNAN